MSEHPPRPPTKAETKVSPLAEVTQGNLYPYWDLNESGLNPYLNAIRRTFAWINPFSHQQIPTSERAAVGIREGPRYYKEDVYPNRVHFDTWYPSHYDPMKNTRFKSNIYTNHQMQPGMQMVLEPKNPVPRFCQRQVQIYKTCLLANDDRQEVCRQEQENIMSICPAFALDHFREKKLVGLKHQALVTQKYRRAMEVPLYNRGRTVADVPLREWQDGQKQNLRPNTLWADDRYADVTQEEVNAAKARIQKRRQAQNAAPQGLPTYDRTYEAPPTQVPLYSV